MPTPTSSNHCLRYWDLADHIRIDDAIALWCGVEPAELAKLNFETQCMSAKRAAARRVLGYPQRGAPRPQDRCSGPGLHRRLA